MNNVFFPLYLHQYRTRTGSLFSSSDVPFITDVGKSKGKTMHLGSNKNK